MAKKVVIPLELKLDFFKSAYMNTFRRFLYAIREEYGAAKALEMYEKTTKMDDSTKNLANTLLTIFKIEGNDAETIGKWHEIFHELVGFESTVLERSKTINRYKVTKCPLKPAYRDLSGWCLIGANIVEKTINSKATLERPKALCEGDPYCEFITKIEE